MNDEKNISATVSDGRSYSVRIRLNEDGSIGRTQCSCPYGQQNQLCVHMAALLYAFEKLFEENTPREDARFYPFRDDFDGKSYYFNLHEITRNIDIKKRTYERAQSMIDNRELKAGKITCGFMSGNDQQVLEANAVDSNGRNIAHITISPDRIISHSCYSSGCNVSSQFYSRIFGTQDWCVHEVALLIMIRDYILKNRPGDHTSRSALFFLNQFSDSFMPLESLEESYSRHNVFLTPHLDFDGYLLKADFRIGTDKAYVVKNLGDLVDSVSSREEYPLGTTGMIDFSRNSFDSESQRIFKYIDDTVREERTRSEFDRQAYTSSSGIYGITRSIALVGNRIDDFFDLMEGNSIELRDHTFRNDNTRKVMLKTGNPQIELTLSQQFSNRQFIGIRLQGTLPQVIKGNHYSYYLDNDSLFRMSPELGKAIDALRRGSVSSEIDYIIGKNYLSQFYNHIMPALKGFVSFRTDENRYLQEYVPEKPQYDFYFDLNEGMISCLPQITYGEEKFSMTDMDGAPEVRDIISERAVASVLRGAFDHKDDRGNLITQGSDDKFEQLFDETIPKLQDYGEVHSTDAFDRLRYHKSPNLSIGVAVENNLLELDIRTMDLSLEDLAGIISSYRLRKKYHKLKNGTFIRSDDESIEELSALLDSLNISLKDFTSGKMHIPAYRALYLDRMLEKNNAIYDNRDFHFRRMIKDFKTINEADYEVPDSLKDIMRPYQKYGFSWLKTLAEFNFGGILADEMGLGKTLQMISVLLDGKNHLEEGTSLVVCPASLIYNWLAEFRRFAPEIRAVAVSGSQSERKKIISEYQNYDVLITSYDLLKRDIEEYQDKAFLYQILDEAQYIKTHTTANAKSCKVINAARHFALTGTPIENNLSELWSIFDFLMPGFLYSYDYFRRNYEVRITRDKDEETSARLKEMIAPFILRRKKMDVLSDLPEKIEEIIKVQFDSQQQKLYDSQVLKMTKKLQESDNDSFSQQKIAILAELTKIRQICCEPALIFEDYYGASAKREACLELIQNAIDEGHKILLFSQFTTMLQVIEDKLNELGIPFYKLTGSTPKEQRVRMVDAFNENDIPVFLISLKAGGTGLNLTGADIVIHYDPWWNIAAQNQATD
ncbi:MAG: SNF2 helicase associated domain-containing protein, partial [Erysipelotrichaceae bacterium]|nr:SNF2 helicase associated domain-containing protein [Erysipelotrichaceae bacterium]